MTLDHDSSGLPQFERRARALGRKHNDASPGDHNHNGLNSKKLMFGDSPFSDFMLYATAVSGTLTTDAAGRIFIPHNLGVLPIAVFWFSTGTADRGIYTRISSSDTTSLACIECYTGGNVLRGAGVALGGQGLVFA